MAETAKDVMTKEVTTVAASASVEELIHMFRVSHFTGVPVVDDDGRAVGHVSETDILRAFAYTINPPGSGEFETTFQPGERGRDKSATTRLLRPKNIGKADQVIKMVASLLTRQVQDLMTPVVHSCGPDSSLAEVCETMAWKGVHRIIVLDADKKVVGLISALDAVRKFGETLRGK